MNQEKKIKRYYRFHSVIYDATRWLFLFNRQKALLNLNLKEGDSVIDFACGTGLNLKTILNKTKKVSAIDFSEDMLKIARNKFKEVNFIQGDACSYKFEKQADKIICTYSLSLIENWQEAVKNMSRNLNENGTLVILDFHKWHGIIGVFYPLFRWWLRIHSVNSEMSLEGELKKYFQSVEMKTYFWGYNLIAIAHRPLK